MPSWSPDGTHLVCHTYSGEGIIVMKADGSGRESIVNHWGSPRWCPRRNRIASITETRDAIALFDCATGIERTIFRGPYSLRQGFGISPDGLRFCFGDYGGGVGLATMNERTMRANVRWLTKSGQCFHASWRPTAVALSSAGHAPKTTWTSFTSWMSILTTRQCGSPARIESEPIPTPIGRPTAKRLFSSAKPRRSNVLDLEPPTLHDCNGCFQTDPRTDATANLLTVLSTNSQYDIHKHKSSRPLAAATFWQGALLGKPFEAPDRRNTDRCSHSLCRSKHARPA